MRKQATEGEGVEVVVDQRDAAGTTTKEKRKSGDDNTAEKKQKTDDDNTDEKKKTTDEDKEEEDKEYALTALSFATK